MNYLEIAGTLIGLLYLWFEYRASIWLWPVSVIMPAIYIVVYYQVGLYADSVISIYYLLAGIYGWWMYNPQIQISAESETKRSIFREKDKTKRSKKESAQHSKSRNKSFVMTSVSAL